MTGRSSSFSASRLRRVSTGNAARTCAVPPIPAEIVSDDSGVLDRECQARAAAAAQRIMQVAAATTAGEKRVTALQRAAEALGVSFRRAKALLYAEHATILEDELADLRRRVLPLLRLRLARAEAEVRELQTIIEGAECQAGEVTACSGWQQNCRPDCCSDFSPASLPSSRSVAPRSGAGRPARRNG